MPVFQRKYTIEIDVNVMGSEERHRNWTEEWSPGQRGRAQLLTTFGQIYDRVITLPAEGWEVTEADDRTTIDIMENSPWPRLIETTWKNKRRESTSRITRRRSTWRRTRGFSTWRRIRGRGESYTMQCQCHVMLFKIVIEYYVCDCPWTKSFIREKKISIESENRRLKQMCVCSVLFVWWGERGWLWFVAWCDDV